MTRFKLNNIQIKEDNKRKKMEKNYLERIGEDGQTEFGMETERIDVPRFVGLCHFAVVVLLAFVSDGDVVPGPITVSPIEEILKMNWT